MPNLSVKIDTIGFKELSDAFKKSPNIVKKQIDPAIRKALLLIQARATPIMPVDRGELRNSNSTSFSPLRGILENKAPHAIFVHEGTRPHFPPLQAIERWANRHGIPPFLVAKAISKKGTKAIPFYDTAIKQTEPAINQMFDVALKNITSDLSK